MAYGDMRAELRGSIPKLPYDFAGTLVNRAWRTVRERNLWSFQLFEGQWITPPLFQPLVTTTIGLNTVTMDGPSTTAFNALLITQPYSLATQRQFRIALSGIYNIWAYDLIGGVLTLDRPFAESTGSGQTAMIYQAYYIPQRNAGATPEYLSDFRTWISVRNIQYFIDLYTERYNRRDLDAIDPQRSMYFWPTDVIPYQKDQNPASATYGSFMYELWGHALANYIYQLMGIRSGLDLSAPTDTLPSAVGEDCVLALARVYSYEWAEANKDMNLRQSGPDFRFLMGQAQKEFEYLLKLYRKQDREQVDNWFSVRRSAIQGKLIPYYNTPGNTAFPGAFGT